MRIIIEGAGEVGSHLAKMLRGEDNSVTVIDDSKDRLDKLASTTDVMTVCGSPTSISVLKEAGAAKADLVIAVFPQILQEMNVVGALLAKQLGAAKVVARVNDEDYLSAENKLLFKEMGIELMLYPEKSAADEIVDQLRHTAEAMDFARGRLQITAFKLDENSPLLDLKLSEFISQLTREELKEFRIIAITRDGKTIIPKLDSQFHFGDMVFTICRREGMDALSARFGKTRLNISKVMIMGGGSIGKMVATSLHKSGVAVKIIELSRERCLELSEQLPEGIQLVNGDGRNPDFLFEESIADADAFLALTGSDETNVLACVVAKKFGVPRTIAEVENMEYIHLAEEMGVDSTINKKLIMAGRIFKFTLSGKARFVKYMGGTGAEVMEYTVAPGSAVTKCPLKDLDFPSNAIIGGVIRGSDAFIAVGDTQIEAYDRVAVFALSQSMRQIDRFFR